MGFKKPVFIDSTSLASYWAAITTGQMKSEVEYGVQLNIFWLNEQSWLLDFTLEKMRTSYSDIILQYIQHTTLCLEINTNVGMVPLFVDSGTLQKPTTQKSRGWCYTVQNKSSWKQFYNS